MPTTPLRDLRRRDSRSCGRNVPRAPGSRKSGGCPSLLPPTPEYPRPTVLPLQSILSLPLHLPFSQRTKLPPSAPRPFRGRLLSSRGTVPSERPSVSPRIPPAPLKFPFTIPPNTPEAPSALLLPRDAQAWRPSGGSPTLNPLHLLLGLRPDWPGLRLRLGAGRGVPSGRGVSLGRSGESAELGCSSGIRFGLSPSAATSEPQAPPPRLRRRSSGNR